MKNPIILNSETKMHNSKSNFTKSSPAKTALKIFSVGAVATLNACMAILTGYLSAMLFAYIPRAIGYNAVWFFAFAVIFALLALLEIFVCGVWVIRKGRFSV